jgi:hypothetical protein
MQLHELTIHEALGLLRRHEFAATELTQALLDRIVDVDNEVKAYITLTPEAALAEARKADELIAMGADGALLGIPLALKIGIFHTLEKGGFYFFCIFKYLGIKINLEIIDYPGATQLLTGFCHYQLKKSHIVDLIHGM